MESTEANKAKTKSTHGGNIIATAKELGVAVDDLIDMSSNLTPFGSAPGLQKVLADRLGEIRYLPETGSETLRGLFAEKHGLNQEQVLAGNGTTEFIFAIPEVVKAKRALIINPTYADYYSACLCSGLQADGFDLLPEKDFEPDLHALSASLQGGELVFFCNPNNPTGALVPSEELYDFIAEHGESLFLVDESYLPFIREPSLLDFSIPDNLFILSSYSKIYGIPGLRLGFLTSTGANLKNIHEQSRPWGVNRMAQIAGEYLIRYGDDYVAKTIDFVEKERLRIVNELSSMAEIKVIPGAANFILCKLTGKMTAPELQKKMIDRKVMIRNCDNFTNLDEKYFRISLKSEEDNNYFLQTLADVFGVK